MNEEDLLCQQFGNFRIGETSGTDSLCYLTVTDENTIFIKINNNEAFKPIYCSLVYGKEDINGHVVDSQEVLDVEKCTCNLPSNNHDDNNAKFQIKVGSGKYSNELNTFLIITISNNKGAFEDEEGINTVETRFCVANKYFTTLPDSVQHWFLSDKKRIGNRENEIGSRKYNKKDELVEEDSDMEEETTIENFEDEKEYESGQFEKFINGCEQRLKLIRKLDELLYRKEENLIKVNYLTSIVSKSPSKTVGDVSKLAVPSKFLETFIGKISNSHKKTPLHFVVKAMIFRNEAEEECYACILFGKWLVKLNESGLVTMETFQATSNLIYSTDIFRIETNGGDQCSLDTFVYKFAKFCCWWNGFSPDNEINSFHFVYTLIKYLDLEKNLSKDDLLIPYIQNIVVYGGFTLSYYPPVEFTLKIRELIQEKGKENIAWEHYYDAIFSNQPKIEFYEVNDVDSYVSFIKYYYPDYLEQSKNSLGILRNIIISNISKFEELNLKAKVLFEKHPNFSGNSIVRIKYSIGNSTDSVIEGKGVPEEFKNNEDLLVKYTTEYCKQVGETYAMMKF
ncbi:hypothetical protein ABK040_006466 [Willaertia magna]